ncbi:MAG: hypothetical protein ACOY4D_04760 [Pseudomonadota bacterium]|jgi:hypothetical protein
MKRRQFLLLAAVVCLIGLNLLMRGEAGTVVSSARSDPGRPAIPRAEDFTLRHATGDAPSDTAQRDLFYRESDYQIVESGDDGASTVEAAPAMASSAEQATADVETPPSLTPEELDFQEAQSRLAKLMLLGVVFREAQWQAFLADQQQRYLVRDGDILYGRFVVERITTEGVAVKDQQSRASREIHFSGV